MFVLAKFLQNYLGYTPRGIKIIKIKTPVSSHVVTSLYQKTGTLILETELIVKSTAQVNSKIILTTTIMTTNEINRNKISF